MTIHYAILKDQEKPSTLFDKLCHEKNNRESPHIFSRKFDAFTKKYKFTIKLII